MAQVKTDKSYLTTIQKLDYIDSDGRKWERLSTASGTLIGNGKLLLQYSLSGFKVSKDGRLWEDVDVPFDVQSGDCLLKVIVDGEKFIAVYSKYFVLETTEGRKTIYTDYSSTDFMTSYDGKKWTSLAHLDLGTADICLFGHDIIGTEKRNLANDKTSKYYTISGSTVSYGAKALNYSAQTIFCIDNSFAYGVWLNTDNKTSKYLCRYNSSKNIWENYAFSDVVFDLKFYDNTYYMTTKDGIYTMWTNAGQQFGNTHPTNAKASGTYGAVRSTKLPGILKNIVKLNDVIFVYGDKYFTRSVDGQAWEDPIQLDSNITGFAYLNGEYYCSTNGDLYISPKIQKNRIYSVFKGKQEKRHTYINIPNGILDNKAIVKNGKYLRCQNGWDCLYTNYTFDPGPKDTWKLHAQFTTSTTSNGAVWGYQTQGVTSGHNLMPIYQNGKTLRAYMSSTGTSWDIMNNTVIYNIDYWTNYEMEVEWTGKKYIWYLFENGEKTQIFSKDCVNQVVGGRPLVVGSYTGGHWPFNGYINLSKCWVEINGERVWYGLKALEETDLYEVKTYQPYSKSLPITGDVSGFTDDNYISLPPYLSNPSTEYVICFTTGQDVTNAQVILEAAPNISISIKDGKVRGYRYQNNTAVDVCSVVANQKLWVKCKCQYQTKYYYWSSDGINWSNSITQTDTSMNVALTYGSFYIGRSTSYATAYVGQNFKGTVHLNNSYINVFGEKFTFNEGRTSQGMNYQNIFYQGDLYGLENQERYHDTIKGTQNNLIGNFTSEHFGIVPREIIPFKDINKFEYQIKFKAPYITSWQCPMGDTYFRLYIHPTAGNKKLRTWISGITGDNVYSIDPTPDDEWLIANIRYSGQSYNTYFLDNNTSEHWSSACELPSLPTIVNGTRVKYPKFIYGNRYVTFNDMGEVYSSEDGFDWTLRGSLDFAWSDICYHDKYYLVGGGGRLTTSSDGISWTNPVRIASENLKCICYGNNKFVAIDRLGNTYTSTNGTDWSDGPAIAGDIHIYKCICVPFKYNANTTYYRYIGVGYKDSNGTHNPVVIRSADGVTWSVKQLEWEGEYKDVAYMPTTFSNITNYTIINYVGTNGKIGRSYVLQNNSYIDTHIDNISEMQVGNNDWNGIIYSSKSKQLIAFGHNQIAKSAEGLVWELENSERTWTNFTNNHLYSDNKLCQALENEMLWESGTLTANRTTNGSTSYPTYLGTASGANYPFAGQIDLAQTFIKINGQYWWRGIEDGAILDNTTDNFTKITEIRRYI